MLLMTGSRLRTSSTLLLVSVLFVQGCKSRTFNTSIKSAGSGIDLIRPISDWSGELVVPKQKDGDTWRLDTSKRTPDGGVDFIVHNSADPRVKPGQTVHLVWEGLNLRLNVRFSKAVKKLVGNAPNDRKMPAPRLLDGLNDVSPLESLAWHRDPYTSNPDPFEVSLKDATYDPAANRLIIRSEPVQVSGRSVALLKFSKVEPTGKPHEMRLTARHFDKASKLFTGPEVIVIAQESSIQPKVGKTEDTIPMTTVKGINENPMNEEGWYSYGMLNPDGTYKLESLEPRAVMRVGATQKYVSGKDAALHFYEKEQWDEAALVKEKGTVRKTLVEPAGSGDFNAAKELWLKDKGNQRFLVLNLFGWWKWNGKLERDSIIRSGHVALGIARIVTDPFTDEDRFQIEYKQVYGANNEDIAAGSMTWAHYMGNLERGWMYTRPISDVLVRFPEFSRSYQVSTLAMSKPISPMDILEQKLEFMTASFRVGADKDNDAGGTANGVSIISAANSCSQDSTQAMFMTLEKVLGRRNDLNMGTTLSNLDAWAENSGSRDEQAVAFNKLRNIYRCATCKTPLDFDQLLFRVWIGDKVRKDWSQNLLESEKEQPRLVSRGDFMASLLAGIWSARSIFPRAVHDRYTRIFLENGAGLWNLQTLQIGGTIDGLEPVAPNRPPSFVD